MPRQQPWTFCSKCNHQVYDWDKYCPLCFSPNPYYRYQKSSYDRKEVGIARSSTYHNRVRRKTPADKKRKEKEDNKCCIIMLVIFAILCILGKLFSVH